MVVTVITVLSSLGYWRSGSVVSARSPTSRMSRLTTSESTGRRMKMSVKDTRRPPSVRQRSVGRHGGRRRQRVGGGEGDRGAVGELDLARGGDTVARLQPFEDGHHVVETVAGLDEGALDLERRTARRRGAALCRTRGL